MKTKRNLAITCILFMIICIFEPTQVLASQSKSQNYSRNYSLNGNGADDIVAVAQAQLGKTKSQLGYTEAWCADFVSDCAELAGQGSKVPFDGYCQTLYNKIINSGGQRVYSPQKGDLVFYYCSKCSVHWCHVGIMINSTQSIEGNYGGKVSLVNGRYTDGNGHSLSNGIVTRMYVRPAYQTNVSSLITPQLSLNGLSNEFEKGENITFNWTRGGTSASGYNLYVAPLIQGTVEYDWSNARNYVPGYASTSFTYQAGTLKPGAYAAYVQAWDIPNNKYSGQSNFVWFVIKDDTSKTGTAQWKIWISRSKMGSETEIIPVGKTCYLCYQIIDKDTKKNWDELYDSEYKVKETITKPNGTNYNSYTYTNDNNWISITPTQTGEYKGIVEVSGIFAGQNVNARREYKFTVKKYYYGDVDGDGDITVTDLSIVNQAANNTKSLTADQKKRADVNADGTITKADVTLIQQYMNGTITKFPAESHVHSYSSRITKNATCSSTGVRTYTCTCGASYTTTISKASHTVVTDSAVAATCTRNGKTRGSHCSVCGTVITAQKTVVATGHVHTEVRNAKAATTSSYGYTGDIYCKDCGAKISTGKLIEKIQSETPDIADTTDSNGSNENSETESSVNNNTPNNNQTEAGNIPTDTNTETSWEENDGTVTNESYGDNDSEDDTLEVGDMLYDAGETAEYEVIKIIGNTVYVSYNAVLNKKQKVVTVPNQITAEDGTVCEVTAISENAFRNNKYVKRIVLSDNVTEIGARAFSGCKKLSSLTVKSKKITSKSLSAKAFKGISSKTKIKVPKENRSTYKKLFCKKGLSKRVKICNM